MSETSTASTAAPVRVNQVPITDDVLNVADFNNRIVGAYNDGGAELGLPADNSTVRSYLASASMARALSGENVRGKEAAGKGRRWRLRCGLCRPADRNRCAVVRSSWSSSWAWDSKAVIARCKAERLSLALMKHPNFARMLDSGTTVDGFPRRRVSRQRHNANRPLKTGVTDWGLIRRRGVSAGR